jgi:hypothetical protein
MSESSGWSRRKILGLSVLAFATQFGLARAQSAGISVFRDPSCGCCGGWVDHLKQAGYSLTVEEHSDLDPIKRRLGIPEELWACHTATLAGYAIEGHVPAHALARLLAESPSIKGIAVPGMPIGSPGMEAGGREDLFEVLGFDGSRRITFGRYRGDQPA